MLNLKFSNKAAKFLERCDDKLYERIIEEIKKLRENPFPSGFKRVKGRKNKTFRIRIGDYRVLYVLIKKNNDLFIADIDRRPRVYD